MKIIVTGGAGYIGSHTVVELIASGFQPIILDNMSNTDARNLYGIKEITGKDIKFYNVDCINKNAIQAVFQKEKNIQAVIHFAAFKSVEESFKEPEKYFKNNIGSLELILSEMKKNNIQYIIFSSSCSVYGFPDILPVNESSPFNQAESPYAETKQICENILQKSGLFNISLRYFNPIGSHPSALIGDCSNDKPANLIPIICEVASGKRNQLLVNGDNYNTIDGTCVRDYIHVVDLAKSHVAAMQYLLSYKKNDIFNIGTGKGLSVLQAISAFQSANKIKIKYKIGSRRKGDIQEIYSNTTKANKLLNWKSKKSINEAMIDAWRWEKNKEK